MKFSIKANENISNALIIFFLILIFNFYYISLPLFLIKT